MDPRPSSGVLTLPYYCDPHELPGPLPTLSEIKTSGKILPCVWTSAKKRIVVVRDLFVVKYGDPLLVDGNEGHALMALHGIPTIPRLYAMYRQENELFLVMQYLPGVSLNLLWDTMSENEKTDVVQQLHQVFVNVRKLPPPSPPVFGDVVGGPVPHQFFRSLDGDPAITGPFTDEAAFHDAMGLNLQDELIRRNLSTAMGRHTCVFTHGDLQHKNILVVEGPTSPGQPSCRDNASDSEPRPRRIVLSGVVDWEGAGWMPSYWEFASNFMYNYQTGNDWINRLDGIFGSCFSEAAILMVVRRNFDGF